MSVWYAYALGFLHMMALCTYVVCVCAFHFYACCVVCLFSSVSTLCAHFIWVFVYFLCALCNSFVCFFACAFYMGLACVLCVCAAVCAACALQIRPCACIAHRYYNTIHTTTLDKSEAEHNIRIKQVNCNGQCWCGGGRAALPQTARVVVLYEDRENERLNIWGLCVTHFLIRGVAI